MNAQVRQLFPVAQPATDGSGHRGSMRLSHSRKQVMVTCGRKFQLQYIQGLEPIAKPSALLFGSAVHSALAQYLTAWAFNLDCDPVGIFEEEWNHVTSTEVVEYSTGWDAQEMAATGTRLISLFLTDWKQRKWTVVLDALGVPVVERELLVRLPNGDSYIVIIDLLVRDAEGRIIVLDFKTPAQAADDEFSGLSDQLLGYQMACDAHANALGIRQVDLLGFYELLKKKIPKKKGDGPVIHLGRLSERRSQDDIQAFVRELMFVARDIREKRFARRAMDAYASNCGMCPFVLGACQTGDTTGLIVRHRPREAPVPEATPATPF